MVQYGEVQPRPGDKYLGCGHISTAAGRWHFWRRDRGIAVDGPDGRFTVRWLIACVACTAAAGGQVGNIAWNETGIWKGKDPIIEAPT